MNNGIAIVQKQNLKIFEPDSNNVVTCEYQQKIYLRNNILFNVSLKEKALQYCNQFIIKHKKQCILVDEKAAFSVWQEVKSESHLSSFASTPLPIVKEDQQENPSQALIVSSSDLYVTQATLLIVQILIDDIEDLMGNRHKNSFEQEIMKIFQKYNLPQTESEQKIKTLLTVDPLDNDQLPVWKQDQIDRVFSELAILCIKYFHNTNFIDLVINNLKELSVYNNPQFVNCCMQFVLFSRI